MGSVRGGDRGQSRKRLRATLYGGGEGKARLPLPLVGVLRLPSAAINFKLPCLTPRWFLTPPKFIPSRNFQDSESPFLRLAVLLCSPLLLLQSVMLGRLLLAILPGLASSASLSPKLHLGQHFRLPRGSCTGPHIWHIAVQLSATLPSQNLLPSFSICHLI